MKNDIGTRMKKYYEEAYCIRLPRRMPVILRLDGKAFHSIARGCDKPFDAGFMNCMNEAALSLCSEIQGAQIAYIQSDEISILLHNYKRLNSDAWFDNKIQKIVSVAAGIASYTFSKYFGKMGLFDARVFVLPEAEVCNYFIWRQRDWERNSIQMLAQSLYSYKELQNKNNDELQELCFQKGKNWNDLATELKRGRCAYQTEVLPIVDAPSFSPAFVWLIDYEIPIFSKYRHFIENHLKVEEI